MSYPTRTSRHTYTTSHNPYTYTYPTPHIPHIHTPHTQHLPYPIQTLLHTYLQPTYTHPTPHITHEHNPHIPSYTHTLIHTYTKEICKTDACMYVYAHMLIFIQTHAHTHTFIKTHANTRTYTLSLLPCTEDKTLNEVEYVTRPMHVCALTQSCVWLKTPFMCGTWLIHVRETTHSCVWPGSLHVYQVSHLYVWRDAFMCVTWNICVRDSTHRVGDVTHSC